MPRTFLLNHAWKCLMQIESPLLKPTQNKQHIVQMILSVAIFMIFFYLWVDYGLTKFVG